MRWLLVLVLLIHAGGVPSQDSAFTRMKIVYCYTRYSLTSQDTDAPSDARIQAKVQADSLFHRYQRALESSKGTLMETALQDEATKARTVEKRDLSTAEFFMILESCGGLVASNAATPE